MHFKTFPEFTTLTPNDRYEYEKIIKSYPPIADFSFPFLMGWWGLRNPVAVSLLEGNLIVSYCTKENDVTPELSFIGTNHVDECICEIFDYMREQGKIPKFVHIPEFVIDSMRYPELFNFEPERGYDEYIISVSKFYPLDGAAWYHKKRVTSFMKKFPDARVSVGPIDLSNKDNKEQVLKIMQSWPKKGINSLASSTNGAFENAIRQADELGFKNACVSLDGKLQCVMLFHAPEDGQYINLEYIKVSYAVPNILNFSINMLAEWAAKQGVEYVNMGMDFGKPTLRVAKVALHPINFFRKYTLEPAQPAIARDLSLVR